MSLEREENLISESYNNGKITLEQYNQELRDLYRSYRAEAEESAQEAYEDELSNW